MNDLKTQLHAADAHNVPPPPPLDVAAVKALLTDMRELLNQEIPAAAEAIRALTGQITIRQEQIPGKKRGARWIASFSPDLLGWLRRGTSAKHYPDSITLEYLGTRIWITPETVDVVLDHVPKYEELSGKVAELAARGTSVKTIAAALGQTWTTVDQALDFARTGRRPKTKPAGKRTGKGHSRCKRIDVAEVVRLRDERQLSFKKIAQRLGATEDTIVRAYDRGNPHAVREAAASAPGPLILLPSCWRRTPARTCTDAIWGGTTRRVFISGRTWKMRTNDSTERLVTARSAGKSNPCRVNAGDGT